MNTEMTDRVLERIFVDKPVLRGIFQAENLGEYFTVPLRWNPERGVFPMRSLLEGLVLEEVGRLYGSAPCDPLRELFSWSWTVEMGAHLHLPRRYDRVSKKTGGQINPVVFQGQTAWAAVSYATLGGKINFSMNSGRVPPDNSNSGAYLEFSPNVNPLRLVRSEPYRETPQILIPAVAAAELAKKLEPLRTLLGNKRITDAEYAYAVELIGVLGKYSGRFTDQVAAGHSHIMSRLFPHEIRQVTIDSEGIGATFMVRLLGDSSSVLHRIFSDESLRARFYDSLKGIGTGWKDGESMFNEVDFSKGEPRLREYRGDLAPGALVDLLARRSIFPKGILKYFALMVEGGLCPIGGMFQSTYCTDLRDRSVSLLETMGEKNRSGALAVMPTTFAAVTPCWGMIRRQEGVDLLNAIDCVSIPLTSADFQAIAGISGKDSLRLATPLLSSLLLREDVTFSYADLQSILGNVVCRG